MNASTYLLSAIFWSFSVLLHKTATTSHHSYHPQNLQGASLLLAVGIKISFSSSLGWYCFDSLSVASWI